MAALLGCAAPRAAPHGLAYPLSPAASGSGSAASVEPERAAALGPPTSTRAPVRSTSSKGSIDATALPSFSDAPFAFGGPLLVEAAASDGRWLSVCQARTDSDGDGKLTVSFGPRGEAKGDALKRYLIAPSTELEIDGLLRASDDGRYALALHRGALLLWDNRRHETLDLSARGADARLSAESFDELRTAAFDANSERILYVRAGLGGPRVVVRSLQDDSEREFDPGPGSIWRARFAPGGSFVVLEMMTQDSNKNGRSDFPAPLSSTPRPCAASPGRFHTFVDRGDRPETVLLPLNGAPAIHEPNLVMPVADGLLTRDESGALLLERGGKKRVLEPSACRGRIVHADALRELFIIGCAQKKKTGRVSLELVTRTERKALDLELASVELDRDSGDSPRLVVLYPGSDTLLFDADRRELHALRAGDVVVATRAHRALIRRGKELVFYDADTRAESPLPYELEKFPDVRVAQPYAFVSPLLVDLESAVVVGVTRSRPLALSNRGQLLVTDGDVASSGLVSGPLRWLTPSL